MKDDGFGPVVKWRPQSPGVRPLRRLLAIKMNNFVEDSSSPDSMGTWPQKGNKKRKYRPRTATLDKPQLLDITLISKIDMSLMTKEILAVYRLMRFPLEARKRTKDKHMLALKHKEVAEESKPPKIIIEITPTKESKEIRRKDLLKDKSSFKLFPKGQKKSKVDSAFTGPTGRPLPKPCDSCGRESRPERLHAHPQRSSLSINKAGTSSTTGHKGAIVESGSEKHNQLTVNRLTSLNEKRSPSHKSIEESPSPAINRRKSKECSPKKESRTIEISSACTFCGRRFGTSLALHEAKCREKTEKISQTKNNKDESSKISSSRELEVQDVSLQRLSPKIFSPRVSLSKENSPRRIKDRKTVDAAVYQSKTSPERLISNIAGSNINYVSSSELINDAEESFYEENSEVDWKNHLRSLIKCNICGRAFAPDRVLRHQSICDGYSRRLPINGTVNTRKGSTHTRS